MKSSEIRERSDQELGTLIGQLQEDLFKLRVQRATNQLEDTSRLRQLRRDIARANTVLKARTLGLEQAPGGA